MPIGIDVAPQCAYATCAQQTIGQAYLKNTVDYPSVSRLKDWDGVGPKGLYTLDAFK